MEAAGLAPQAAVRARPLSREEIPRLHSELALWMRHTQYQLQPMDNSPIWRMQNTSVCVATGVGIPSFYAFKRSFPKIKFPWDAGVPFVMFYLTYRLAQAWQLPGLYGSVLTLSTPLGLSARGILEALRGGGGRLPSQEFGDRPAPAPRGAGAGGAAAAAGGAGAAAAQAAPPDPWADEGGALGAPSPRGVGGPTPTDGAAGVGFGDAGATAPAAPSADPWGDGVGVGGVQPGGNDWAAGDGAWDATGPKRAPPARRTWDEIRAEAARRDQEQR